MELTRNHRRALLSKLESVQEELSITKKCMEKTGENDSMKQLFEIDDFLQKHLIELIKSSLTENQIDY